MQANVNRSSKGIIMRLNLTPSSFIVGILLFLFSALAGAETYDDSLLIAEASQPSYPHSADAPLTVFFQIGPVSMGQTSNQATATPGDDYPPEASFSQVLFNGPVGFTTVLGGWWKLDNESAVGLTNRLRWSTYKLRIDNNELSDTASDIMVMGMYQQELAPNLHLEAGLGYHKLDGVYFKYTKSEGGLEKTGAELFNMSVHGLRMSGALSGNSDAIHYRVEVGETFGILPAATTLAAEASYNLPESVTHLFPILVGIQYQFTYRDLTAKTTFTEISVGGTEQILALTIGGSFDLFGEGQETLPEEEGSLDL